MFGLTQYKVPANTLVTLTGISIAPVVSAFRNLQESKSIVDVTLPTLNPPAQSNDWTEWLLSGYLGNFLDWTGKQLAYIGSNVFPAPNKFERLQTMRAHAEGLKQFLSEQMLDKDVDADISAALNTYLRSGRSLIKEESLEPAEWQEELKNLQSFSEMTGDKNTAAILSEWIEQLDLLREKKGSAAEKRIADLSHHNSLAKRRVTYHRDRMDSRTDRPLIVNEIMKTNSGNVGLFPARRQLGSTVDLATLGNAGMTIEGKHGGDFSGYAVSGAGDVNGDGIADVIIGAPIATGDQAYSGVSYVVFGSNSTVLADTIIHLGTLSSSKAGFTINGADANNRAGYSVSGAGDVNGDGFADVIIGAPSATGVSLYGI